MSATLDSLLAGETVPGLFDWRGASSFDLAQRAMAAGWSVRPLNTVGVQDRDQLYDRVALDWDLPRWFGRNLDAWWDVLGDLAQSPLLVDWKGYADLAAVDPELAQTVLELFRDACTQAKAMAVVVHDAPAFIGLDGLL